MPNAPSELLIQNPLSFGDCLDCLEKPHTNHKSKKELGQKLRAVVVIMDFVNKV